MLNIKNRFLQSSLSFINTHSGVVSDTIWSELEAGLWKEILLDNIIENDQVGDLKREEWKKIFPHISPIYPGFYWDKKSATIREMKYYPHYKPQTFQSFVEIAANYFARFEGKKIGVHLSGGLDSSIIIGLLRYLKIPFTQVGLVSNNYEFRTEYRVQKRLAEWNSDTTMIDMANVPSFCNMDTIPPHQVPADGISGYASGLAIAKVFKDKDVEVVFTGMGGDNVFGNAIPDNDKNFFWQPYEYRMPWSEDYIYIPKNIQLISFFAEPTILDAIYSLRLGQKRDIPKRWARQFFKDILPQELITHTYNADFWGVWLTGLHQAKPVIKRLFEQANHLLPNSHFAPQRIKHFIEQDFFSLSKPDFLKLASRISVAVWLNSLHNNSISYD